MGGEEVGVMSLADLRVAVIEAERLNPSLRVRVVHYAGPDLAPESIPLTYGRPLVESADFNGYATHDGRVERF